MNAAKAIAVGGLILVGSASFTCGLRSGPGIAVAPTEPREPLISEIIEQERKANGLPPFLIEALIAHESRFDEFAANPEKKSKCYKLARNSQERSACKSRGLMQVQFKHHGKGLEFEDDLYRVAENIRRGSAWLGQCYRAKHGNEAKALGCYNGDVTGRYASAVLDWKRRLERHAEQIRNNRGGIG